MLFGLVVSMLCLWMLNSVVVVFMCWLVFFYLVFSFMEWLDLGLKFVLIILMFMLGWNEWFMLV